jgi:sec-independent protein translocase protein TatA
MGELLQPTHLIVIGILFFILFGAKRLPEFGKGLGEGLKGLKDGLKGLVDNPAPAPLHDNAAPATNWAPVDPDRDNRSQDRPSGI